MPLFEHMPYTNYQNANLDWLTTQVKKNETDIATIQTTIAGIEGQITMRYTKKAPNLGM